MRKVVLSGIRRFECVTAPEPAPVRPDDVLIRISRVGVCGSDVHYYTEGRIGSQVVVPPFAVGHECSGTVAAVGSGVKRLRPGDLVAVDPAISCGHCDQCRTDRPHTCRELRFLGCPGQIEGCLADFLVMPEACCFRVPDGLSPDAAAFAEPLSIGIYAARLAGSLGGAAAAVLGCGPIGLCVLLAARAAGARALYASDPVAARRGAAAACGADWTAGPEGLDRPDALADLEPLQLDAVFECCGRQEALDQAVALLKPGGRLMVVGIPAKDRVSFPIDLLRRREIRIVNVRRQCECVPAALESLAAGRVPLASLVTHHFAPGRVAEAFDLAAGYGDGLIKAMIDFD